jgi:hypothetical protein
MTWFGACGVALCVHAQVLADAGAVRSTSAASGDKLALETFVQLFLAGFLVNLVVQAMAALRRLRSDFKAVQRP